MKRSKEQLNRFIFEKIDEKGITYDELSKALMEYDNEKHFPEAAEWMWNYCVFLGKFTDSKGVNYDLGIFTGEKPYISAAIVYGNEPGKYLSGRLNMHKDDWFEHYAETSKRAEKAGYKIL